MYQHSPATTGCYMRLNWVQKIIERRTGKLRRELEVVIPSREKRLARMHFAHARVEGIKHCAVRACSVCLGTIIISRFTKKPTINSWIRLSRIAHVYRRPTLSYGRGL